MGLILIGLFFGIVPGVTVKNEHSREFCFQCDVDCPHQVTAPSLTCLWYVFHCHRFRLALSPVVSGRLHAQIVQLLKLEVEVVGDLP